MSRFAEAVADKTLGQLESFFSDIRTRTLNYRSLTNLTAHIDHQYRGRCVTELVQNAHDPLKGSAEPRRIRVAIVEGPSPHGCLVVANTGAPLGEKNFHGLASLGQSSKKPGEGIGHKGVGFRSVLELTDTPEVFSKATAESTTFDGYCFRMDPEAQALWIASLHAHTAPGQPWHVPIGALHREVPWEALSEARQRAEEQGLVLEHELRKLSPYLLPLPFEPDAMLTELAEVGFVTVVRLPLRNADARAEAIRQLDELRGGDALLFLDDLDELQVGGLEPQEATIERAAEVRADGSRTIVLQHRSGELVEFRRWDRTLPVTGPLADARALLPPAWASLDEVTLSIAVPVADRSPTIGHVFVHFPTRTTSGSAARIQAPFHAELSRQGLTRDRWNDVLMGELVVLGLEVSARLAASTDPRDALLLIDLLAPRLGPEGSSAWHQQLLASVVDRPLFRDRRGHLRPLRELRWVRPTAQSRVVTGELLSEYAAFHELASVYAPRLVEIDALATRLGMRLEPTEAELATTLEGVAAALLARGGLDENWAGFYEDCADLLPRPAALVGKRVVIDQRGTLQVAGKGASQDVACFFPPQDGPVRVPDLLADRISFLVDRVTLNDPKTRAQTRARQYLEPLLDGFDVRSVIERVVGRVVPRSRIPLEDANAEICRQSLELVGSLLASSERGASGSLLRRVRLPCRGGWCEGGEATFGPEWSTPNSQEVSIVALELPEGAFADRLLLAPGHAAWGAFPAHLLKSHDFGVRDGLRPEALPDGSTVSFRGSEWPGFDLEGVPTELWRAFRSLAPRAPAIWSGSYRLDGVEVLWRLLDIGKCSREAQIAFARMVVRGWVDWKMEKVSVVKVGGYHDAAIDLPSFVEHMLREVPWIPDEGGKGLRRPRELWYVRGAPSREARRQYAHLDLVHSDVARVIMDTGEAKGITLLRRVGTRIFDLEDPSCAKDILEGLADAVRGPPNSNVRSQLRQAWQSLVATPFSTLPSRVVVDWSGSWEVLTLGADEVFVPSTRRSGSLQGLFADYPVVVMEPRHGERIVELARLRGVPRVASLDDIEVNVLTERGEWAADPYACAFARSEYGPLAPAILAVLAHAEQGKGPHTQAFQGAVLALRGLSVEHHERVIIRLGNDMDRAPVDADAHLIPSEKRKTLLIAGTSRPAHRTLEPLARPLAEVFGRQVQKELQLLLSSLERGRPWSGAEIDSALQRVGIGADRLPEIQEIWGETAEWILDRARPVLVALGEQDAPRVEGLDALRARLGALVPESSVPCLIEVLSRAPSDEAIGRDLHRKLGEAFELHRWNAALAACTRPTLENEAALDSLKRHLRNAAGLLRCVARRVMELVPTATWTDVHHAATDPVGVAEHARERWAAAFADAMKLVGGSLRASGCPDALAIAIEGASTLEDLRSRVLATDPNVDFEIDPVSVLAENRQCIDRALGAVLPFGDLETRAAVLATLVSAHERDLVLRRWSDLEVDACVSSTRAARTGPDAVTHDGAARAPEEPSQAPAAQPVRARMILGEQYVGTDPSHRGLAAIVDRFLAKAAPEMSLDAIETTRPDSDQAPQGWKRSGPFSARDARGRPTAETADLIGFLGELFVFRLLSKKYGVGPSAWVSANGDQEFPGNQGNDTVGFDFQFESDGITYQLEVKTTTDAGGVVELTSTEVHAAMRAAHSPDVRYLILEVVDAMSRPRVVTLANPFTAEGAERVEVSPASMRVRYHPVARGADTGSDAGKIE